MPEPFILLIGTCDTKLHELLFTRSQILSHKIPVKLMDAGRTPISHPEIDITQSSFTKGDHTTWHRHEIIAKMISDGSTFVRSLYSQGHIAGLIAIGGSGGTSLGSAIMRSAVPIGVPKLVVSTVMAGDVSHYVGETDLTIMYSVVDVAGTNSVLDPVLENAAGMIAGAAKVYLQRQLQQQGPQKKVWSQNGKVVAITMFGVTTPAGDEARKVLVDAGYEVQVFHVTGVGGRHMERLIREGYFAGVVDLTPSELTDEVVGGNMSAGPERLTGAGAMGVPQVVSLGALEIVNFGSRGSVPKDLIEEKGRKVLAHSPVITLLQTNVEEARVVGGRVAERLKGAKNREALVKIFVPEGGLDMLNVEGNPFSDREVNGALYEGLTRGLEGSGIEILWDKRTINEKGFGGDMAKALLEMMKKV